MYFRMVHKPCFYGLDWALLLKRLKCILQVTDNGNRVDKTKD